MLIAYPGRRDGGASREMDAQGYAVGEQRRSLEGEDVPYPGRSLRSTRAETGLDAQVATSGLYAEAIA